MVSLEFFNNLNPTIASIFKVDVTDVFLHELSVLLINIVSYLYILLKFYKVLCYSRMTFDWMPMINPYIWPFSFFQLMTGPYFAFWSKILPNLKLEKSSIEISGIVGLEALNALIYFCVRFTNILIVILKEKEKIS